MLTEQNRLARAKFLADAAGMLGAGLGQAGHYFMPGEAAKRQAAEAEAKRKAGEATRAEEQGAAWHPITMKDIAAEGAAQSPNPFPGMPRVPVGEAPMPAGVAAGALPGGPPSGAPLALPPEVLMTPKPAPPPLPFMPLPGGGVGGAPALMPRPKMAPAGAGGPAFSPAAPAAPPALPGAPAFAPMENPMGKSSVPAPRSIPGLGDFASTRSKTSGELERARRFALAGSNPGLAANLSKETMGLATMEDPEAIARDSVKLAKAMGRPDSLAAVEGTLETRAGREAFANLTGTLAGEGRKSAAQIALERAKAAGRADLEGVKHKNVMEVEGERTKRDLAVENLKQTGKAANSSRVPDDEAAAILDAGYDEEALYALSKSGEVKSAPGVLKIMARLKEAGIRSGRLSTEQGQQADRAIRLANAESARAEAILKRVKDQYPDDMARLDDPEGYAAAVAAAQTEAKPFWEKATQYLKQAATIFDGGTAPPQSTGTPAPAGQPAPAAIPGAPAAPPKPQPTPAKPGDEGAMEDLDRRAAEALARGDEAEFDRIFAESQSRALEASPESKSSGVITPPPPKPKTVPRKSLGEDLPVEKPFKDPRSEDEILREVAKIIKGTPSQGLLGNRDKEIRRRVQAYLDRPKEVAKRERLGEEARQVNESRKAASKIATDDAKAKADVAAAASKTKADEKALVEARALLDSLRR